MKRDNINYLAVGLFVLVSLAVLMVVLYRITGRVGQAESYHVYYDNVTGIAEGSLVTYEGYQVGFVEAIRPEQAPGGTRYRVELRIRKGWRIPEDSRARITASGLLSDTVIDIQEGGSERFLAAGGEIPGAPNTDMFAVMGEVAGDLGSLIRNSLRPLLDNLDRQVTAIGDEVSGGLPPIMEKLNRLVARLDESAAHLNRMLDGDAEAKVDRILDNVDVLAANLATLSDGLRETKAGLDELVQHTHALVDDNDEEVHRAVQGLRRSIEVMESSIDAIVYDLEGASRNMNEFSRQIRNNPGLLLNGRAPADREAAQ